MRTAARFASLVILATGPVVAAERQSTNTDSFPVVEGKRIVIDAREVDVQVRTADVSDIELTTDLHISGVGANAADNWIRYHTPSTSDSTNELKITVGPSWKMGALSFGRLTARARLLLLVPTTVAPDITTTDGTIELRGDYPLADPLRLRTSTGDMNFIGAAASLEVHTASGNVDAVLMRSLENLFARTSSGHISLSGGARHVQVDTASGNVTLANLSGDTQVETSTGKVELRWDRLDSGRSVTARSSSGKVHLTIPNETRPQGTLATTTGTVRCDLPGNPVDQGATFQLSGDGPVLDVETASSEIVVSVAGSWDE